MSKRRVEVLLNYNERVQHLSGSGTIDQIDYRCRFCQDSCRRTIISWRKMLKNSQKMMVMLDVESTLLPRDDESSTPWGWIRGNTKIGPVLEVMTNYHQRKPGIEIRFHSLSVDRSRSWIRISNGLNKYRERFNRENTTSWRWWE